MLCNVDKTVSQIKVLEGVGVARRRTSHRESCRIEVMAWYQ